MSIFKKSLAGHTNSGPISIFTGNYFRNLNSHWKKKLIQRNFREYCTKKIIEFHMIIFRKIRRFWAQNWGLICTRAQQILGALALSLISELLSATRACTQTEWAALTKALLNCHFWCYLVGPYRLWISYVIWSSRLFSAAT